MSQKLYDLWRGRDSGDNTLWLVEIINKTGIGVRPVTPTSVRGGLIYIAHDKAPSGRASFVLVPTSVVETPVAVHEDQFTYHGARSRRTSYRLRLCRTKEEANRFRDAYVETLYQIDQQNKAEAERRQAVNQLDLRLYKLREVWVEKPVAEILQIVEVLDSLIPKEPAQTDQNP